MFASPNRLASFLAARPETDASPMDWQNTLACIGVVTGFMILLCLIYRCCRHIDPMNHELHTGLHEPADAVHRGVIVVVPPPPEVVVVPPPSAEAESQYYTSMRH